MGQKINAPNSLRLLPQFMRKDEANIAALEAAGWKRAAVENAFGLTVLEAPIGSTSVRNDNAVSALKVWLDGTEDKYLLEHPDLWN